MGTWFRRDGVPIPTTRRHVMDARFSALPDSTRAAVEEAANTLDRARPELAAKRKNVARAVSWARAAASRSKQLQARIAEVRSLFRSNGLISGGSDGESATPPPLLTLGQAVRHLERTDIRVVIGLIFGVEDQTLVRRIDGASFEAVGLLIEVGQPAA
jgi:hypothetical protein